MSSRINLFRTAVATTNVQLSDLIDVVDIVFLAYCHRGIIHNILSHVYSTIRDGNNDMWCVLLRSPVLHTRPMLEDVHVYKSSLAAFRDD